MLHMGEPWRHYVSETGHIQKSVGVQFYEIFRVIKFIEAESGMVVARSWVEGTWTVGVSWQ
jgi:hypothetical protein